MIITGLLAQPDYVEQTYGSTVRANGYGLFYGGGGNLLACQIIGIVCILSWVCGLLAPLFFVMSKMQLLRVLAAVEIAGLDVSKHGGQAYSNHVHYAEVSSDAGKFNKVQPLPAMG